MAAALVVLVGPWVSDAPDGLERVARDEGFQTRARSHALDASPVAGYALGGTTDRRVGTAVSGLAGVLGTFGAGLVVFTLLAGTRSAARRGAGSGAG